MFVNRRERDTIKKPPSFNHHKLTMFKNETKSNKPLFISKMFPFEKNLNLRVVHKKTKGIKHKIQDELVKNKNPLGLKKKKEKKVHSSHEYGNNLAIQQSPIEILESKLVVWNTGTMEALPFTFGIKSKTHESSYYSFTWH